MTSSSSPPTERVTRILDLLAAGRPDAPVSAAEVAEQLGMATATCTRVISTLTTAGYLRRAPDGGYLLGPAILRAGRTAQRGFASASLAQSGLEALSTRYQRVGTISAVIGGEIVTLSRCGPNQLPEAEVGVGQRYPFAPPLGLLHALWDDRTMQRWLSVPPLLPPEPDMSRLRQVIRSCRDAGYLIERIGPMGLRAQRLLEGLEQHAGSPEVVSVITHLAATIGEREYLTEELVPGTTYAVSMVCAPVYDSKAELELLLALYLLDEEATHDHLVAVTTSMRALAVDVTEQIGGRSPQPGA